MYHGFNSTQRITSLIAPSLGKVDMHLHSPNRLLFKSECHRKHGRSRDSLQVVDAGPTISAGSQTASECVTSGVV